MTDYFRNKYRINSHRLKGWDYRTPGWYFVTICTFDGIPFLGEIQNNIMGLSDIGCMVWKHWYQIPKHQPHVNLGVFIVMPNHVHLTIELTNQIDNETHVETLHATSLQKPQEFNNSDKFMSDISPNSGSLSVLIRSFKSSVTRWCNNNEHGNFAWQPGFYDHIIRNQTSLENIHFYIQNNPINWLKDRYHPDKCKK